MKKWLPVIAVFLICSMLLPLGGMADEVEEDGVPIATEYNSETLFQNFEIESVPASTVPATAEELQLSATSTILMEVSTGQVLYENNADEQRAPASITKIMTMLLVMEAIEAGKFTMDTQVSVSEHASSMGGSQIWLEVGETMSVYDMLKATAVASANDAATALGELVAGSEEAFVNLMNERAAQLGMTGTHFVNCCGLDAENHYSTARDIAIMSRALLQHDLIKEFSQIWIDYLRGGSTQLVNTNKLVRFYQGTTGLKTGTTDQAGFCVSASAERDGMELVAVVLDGETSDLRFSDAKKLLDFGFANWGIVSIDMSQIPLGDVKVNHGTQETVPVTYEVMDTILVPKGRQDAVTPSVNLPADVEAPVAQGQLLGKITFTLDDEVVGECQLSAANAVEKMSFGKALARLLGSLIRL